MSEFTQLLEQHNEETYDAAFRAGFAAGVDEGGNAMRRYIMGETDEAPDADKLLSDYARRFTE